MSNILVVNATSFETRVALVEDGIISEFYLERARTQSAVGNIYKGKVLRVLPGMQAAFVDISQEKAGFLHVSDFFGFEDGPIADEDDPAAASRRSRRPKVNIQDVIKEGDEIIVQVAKESIGTKGARLTSRISLPGRYAVFMPTVSHIGISRRINDDRERRRLRKIVDRYRPEGAGFIVRTVSQGVDNDKLERDMQLLVKLWEQMYEKSERVKAPYLLHEEPDLLLRSARDLLTTDLRKLVVDDKRAHGRIQDFMRRYMPAFVDAVELYTSAEPIFDAYGIEIEINRALQRRVDLPSGGSLVIDKAEALTAIDINTGRFVGKTSSHEETVFKTNMEAVDEIVYQIRLRNIGGLIIIDFIDMDELKHRDKVYQKLERALERDKVTTNALAISQFGLVEMTRKRVRESLAQYLCEECEECGGRGYIKSKETVAFEVLREIKREAAVLPVDVLYVYAHKKVVDFLKYHEKRHFNDVVSQTGKTIELVADEDRHLETFEVLIKPASARKRA